MFDFMMKKRHTRDYSFEKAKPVNTSDTFNEACLRQQMVENFIRKNEYHGKSIMQYAVRCLSLLAGEKEISQGAFFILDNVGSKPVLRILSAFASPNPENRENILEVGEGFPGQVAKDGKLINISDIPEGYLTIESGLGKSSPVSLILFPVKHDEKVLAVIELASFRKFSEDDELFFSEISDSISDQILKCMNKS